MGSGVIGGGTMAADMDRLQARHGLVFAPSSRLDQVSWGYPSSGAYAGNVYGREASVLRGLEYYLGPG